MDQRMKKLEDNMKKFMETFMRQQNKDDNQSGTQSMLEGRTTTVPGNSSISRNLIYNPKLEFPKFDGFEVENWIRNCEKYFDLFKISEYQRVDMASLHVTGRAEEWITSYLSNKRFVNWHHFAVDLIGRFRYETCVHVCETNSLLKVASESAMKPDRLTDSVEINGNDVHHVFEEITDPLLRKEIDEYVRSDDVDGTTDEADVETGEGIDLEEDSVSDDRLLSSVVVYEVEHEVLKEAIDLPDAMEKAGAVLIREVASNTNDSAEVAVVKVDAAIEAELEDRKLRIEVKTGEMHHESLIEALHGDNIAFLIFDPGGSTFDASLLKNRCCLFHSFNNKYWKINSLSDMKSVANRKMPRTVTTSVWRPVSTEANWSIECLMNDQISAHDEAGEANELCSSESSSTVSKKYDEGNSLGRNMMNELEWMENLGHETHRHNTVVDILCAGTCPLRVSIVQTLAKVCGGVLILHDDFVKTFGVNLQRAIIRAAGFHGLLEVRCSDNISVTQVIGPGEEGNADNHEYVKNDSSLYIQVLSVEEMQCFALSMETRSDIKSEYVYFQLAIQYSNIYHADVSRVITVRLPTVTSWVLTVLGYLAKLVLGILGLVVSIAWIVHIVIYLLIDPPLSAFLNEVFIKLGEIWGLLSTATFAFFCMYLLFAVIAGAMMLLCILLYGHQDSVLMIQMCLLQKVNLSREPIWQKLSLHAWHLVRCLFWWNDLRMRRFWTLALVYSGIYLGSVTGLGLSLALIHKFGWPSVFHSFDSLGSLWFAL